MVFGRRGYGYQLYSIWYYRRFEEMAVSMEVLLYDCQIGIVAQVIQIARIAGHEAIQHDD